MTARAAGLTARQVEVLEFVRQHSARHGAPPTVREIGAALGIASTNAVAGHLDALVRAGAIERVRRQSRGLRASRPAGSIPILGRIAAGRPILAQENIEGTLLADPYLARDPDATFALRVEGDSMSGDAILPGDILVVRRQSVAERGRIVVALIDDEATVKRWEPTGHGVRLVPSNPAHVPIEVTEHDGRRLEVLGVVVGVVRRL